MIDIKSMLVALAVLIVYALVGRFVFAAASDMAPAVGGVAKADVRDLPAAPSSGTESQLPSAPRKVKTIAIPGVEIR